MFRLIAAIVGCLLPALATAVPLQLTHQARLLGADAMPLNGNHDVTVALYDSPGGTTARWSELHNVDVQDGFVSIRLGEDDGNALNTDVILDGAALWVGIKVDQDPEMPVRTPLASVPYAARADIATQVDGGPVIADGVKVGDPGATCGRAQSGVVRYSGGVFQGCDGGGNWIDLGQQDTDTLPAPGTGIAVSGNTVSTDLTWVRVERRMMRYHAACQALAHHTYSNYRNVAAVTPGDATVAMTGTAVCNGYNGNNNTPNWTCIGVPYVYNHNHVENGYHGTDVRPYWRGCGTTNGNGSYPWLDPDTGAGVMMACCVHL